jgi:hypothetical protein
MTRRLWAAAATIVLALAGCGDHHRAPRPADPAATLRAYLEQVEPIRLGVNELLDTADPILSGYHEHRLSPKQAESRMGALERRFADYTVGIAEVAPVPASMRAAQDVYAHTFVLEDAYLSALTAAIPEREFAHLPNTQDAQRAAVIAWRTRLEVVAAGLGVRLPADIQQAGRGEIAPSPLGS